MSEINEQPDTETKVSELDMLKQRARLMGITFSNNISLETLRERVNAKLQAENAENQDDEGDVENDDDADNEDADIQPNGLDAAQEVADQRDTRPPENYKPQLDHDGDGHNGGSLPKAAKAETKLSPHQIKAKRRAELIKDQMKLVRCRIQNLDPKKANLPGEIFTVANRILGTVRKYVPYGEVTEDGYHLPYIIYKQLEARKFLNIRTVKDRRTGQIRVENNWAKEFAIDVLPPLTQEELDKLANAQKAAGSIGD